MSTNWATTCCELANCDAQCPDVCKDLCIEAHVQRGAVQTVDTFRCSLDNGSMTIGSETDVEVTRHIFCFAIKVKNCTGRTVNNFRPRLDLRCAFIKESTGELIKNFYDPNAVVWGTNNVSCLESDTYQEEICTLRRLYITTSIGEPNDDFNGPGAPGFTGGLQTQNDPDAFDNLSALDVSSRDGDTTLLKNAVRLPPGETNLNACVAVDVANDDADQIVLLPGIFSFNGQIRCCSGKCLPVHRSVLLSCECLPLEGEL